MATFLNHILEQHLNDVRATEAKVSDEVWTVATKVDTTMPNSWLHEASKFEAKVNKTTSC